MIDKYEEFDETNHCPNVKKQKNQELEPDQIDYKIQHGGFRSKIESELFGEFVKKFKRFEVHTTKRTTNFKIFNLELKLAGLIFNIEKFVKDNKLLFQDYIESSKCVFDINWDFENTPFVSLQKMFQNIHQI
jgi:hypothetical protein